MDALRAGDPRQIGEYRLLGRLGEGGMGSVYLAQSSRGRTVAVKLVRSDLAERADFRRRFAREVRAARQVGGEWTAPVLDAEPDAPQPWLATGYLPGVPLDDAVRAQSEPLPERTVRILLNRLALALGSVHGAGLIHRDVKPSNVLVTLDGPRLIDFGIARALEPADDTQLTRTGAVVGSPAFMSPEQARGKELTSASDVFSLGSTVAFAATGRVPFGDENLSSHGLLFSVAEDEPRLTGVPEGLRDLLTACLAKDVAARPGLDEIVARTADPEGEPGPGGRGDGGRGPDGRGDGAAEPWLPAGLVAQLGQHAARLLDAEVPGAREAADRAAVAQVIPPQPPEPPATGFGPPPERERGNRRRTVVLAGAVALALVAGGTLLAVRAMDGDGSGDEGKKAGGGSSARPSPGKSLKPAPGGALPKQFLGSWQSAPEKPEGEEAVLHRVEVQQGAKGEPVMTAYGTYKDTLCRTVANLVSYDGVVRVRSGPSKPYEDGATCPRRAVQDMVHRNGALVWTAPGQKQPVRLERVRGSEKKPVPKALVGDWRMTGAAAQRNEGTVIRFNQGRVDAAMMRFVGKGQNEGCSWAKVLGAADDGTLVYAGLLGGKGTCGEGSVDMAAPVRVTAHGPGEARITSPVEPGKPVVLKRAR
ncbi:serine/threonine-protein kinase [Streptomyces sp. NPDC048172]|uniref:serine/threonine-protein kinase n=1 Tax=Streptomyces sp. NPDC048172 TaxID=3365505 RepID=UPI00371EC107